VQENFVMLYQLRGFYIDKLFQELTLLNCS